MKSKSPFFLLLLGCLALMFFCGCNSNARVFIEYDQKANFLYYALSADGSGSTSAGTNGLYVLYKITKIRNTGSEAITFTFDANRISTVTNDFTTKDSPGGENILLGSGQLTAVTVAPGQTVTNPGCIIRIAKHQDPASLMNTGGLVDIIYSSTAAQPINVSRVPGDKVTAIVINTALPGPVQSLCSAGIN